MGDQAEKKERLVIMARLSEQAERYEDMMAQMKELVELGGPLSSEERNLFSVAYKNVVGARRSAWRVLVSIKQREDSRASNDGKEGGQDHAKRASQCEDYITKISTEIENTCKEVVDLVDNHLLPSVAEDNDHQSKTFYLKMKGDYYRYVAEVQNADTQGESSKNAQDAYSSAYDICKEKMDEAHPIRLGLALNYSVFFYEIEGDRKKACEVAQEAFDKALEKIDKNDDDSAHKDSTLILQLLRDNLSLWNATAEEDDDADQQMQA